MSAVVPQVMLMSIVTFPCCSPRASLQRRIATQLTNWELFRANRAAASIQDLFVFGGLEMDERTLSK
jgi:hypothetical protein